MAQHEIWREYSSEVLAWQLGHPTPPTSPLSPLSPAAPAATSVARDADATAQRLLRMVTASARPLLALMGMGDGTLAVRLRTSLPDSVPLRILEPSPHRARRVLERFPQLAACLLVDTSPWALLLLALNAGLTPHNCTVGRALPPQQANPSEDIHTLEQWRKLFFGVVREELPPAPSSPPPRISVGAILHPTEPRLNDFFAQIPAWIHEVCVVWDGALPENASLSCAAPLRHCVRSLGNNFSAQRNAMLHMCGGNWCLTLDADERLTPEVWATLPALSRMANVRSVLFPRLTFEGSEERVRMGYGLWPDVQCRFFALEGNIHFQGSVHEQLQGIGGQSLLAPGMPILHYSHVQKNRAQVEEKLHVFNDAAGSSLHVGSAAYPCLPRSRMDSLGDSFGNHTVLRLPPLL